jgi:signal transduction histidine kinase
VAHLPAERIGAAHTLDSTSLGVAPYVEEALRWLPETEDAAPGVPTPSAGGTAPHGARTPAARVLLADDNADMRAYVRRLLETRYAVEAVGDGTEALRAARERPPDLVVADMMMPGLDGFALVRALRADARTRTLPVILLSARAGEEATADGLEAGADDYLVKPFAASELLARVQAHLALARMRAAAMQEVRAERDRMQQVLDLLPEAVVVTDPALIIQFSNRAVRASLGLVTTEPAAHVDVGQAVPSDDGEAVADYGARRLDGTPYGASEIPLVRAALHGEVVRGEQMLLRHADGRDVPILTNAAPLRDGAGALTGAVVVFQDITPLYELDRAREEFLSSAAHDLKTPLTSIRGQAQLAQRRLTRLASPETAPLLGQLARIQTGTTTMVGMINELVDVTRQQMGGALDLHREPTDLVALVQDCVESRRDESGRLIRLETEVPELHADVDAARVSRVVGNLLSNALKYSPAEGGIWVRLAQEEGANGLAAVLTVRDEGIGIPAADLPHIFERFRRASNVAAHIQGTGIGLASAWGIVEQHGGTITVESVEGDGSTFTVRLPLASVPPPQARRADKGGTPGD